MITIFRRHTAQCPHRDRGRDYIKCNCPIWADGYVNGKRTLRRSLKTRDMARARKRAAELEDPEGQASKPVKPVAEAVAAFLGHCASEGLGDATICRYRNTLTRLAEFCEAQSIDSLSELATERLSEFRTGRGVRPSTAAEELKILRTFFRFCVGRKWIDENPAMKITPPRNIKPNEVVPFTPEEIEAMVRACDRIGEKQYERLRTRAMILALRYTALRIGDVAMLARDRISRDSDRWRIFLRTEKSGQAVFLPVPLDLKLALDAVPPPRGNMDSRFFFWNGISKPKTLKARIHELLSAVFKESGVQGAHAHRFRHTLATELLGRGASFEEVADILGNSPEIVRKHYGKWSAARQSRIDDLMEQVYIGPERRVSGKTMVQ
jgi:integrase/recombinase XerC